MLARLIMSHLVMHRVWSFSVRAQVCVCSHHIVLYCFHMFSQGHAACDGSAFAPDYSDSCSLAKVSEPDARCESARWSWIHGGVSYFISSFWRSYRSGFGSCGNARFLLSCAKFEIAPARNILSSHARSGALASIEELWSILGAWRCLPPNCPGTENKECQGGWSHIKMTYIIIKS